MDLAAIKAFFYHYDPSLWESRAREAMLRPPPRAYLGEGRHFQAFRWGDCPPGESLVLRIAKPAFRTWHGNRLPDWLVAINHLGSSGHTLIPPMAAWESADGHILMIMPYLPHVLRPAAVAADPWLQAELSATKAWLSSQNLHLGDEWLVHRGMDGEAFLVDWSELSRIRSGY